MDRSLWAGVDDFQSKVTNRLKKDWEAVKNAKLTPEAQAKQDELIRNPLKGALNTFMDLPEQAAQREEQAGEALHNVTGGRVPKFAGALLLGMLDPLTPPGGKAPISAAKNALRLNKLSNATKLLANTTLNRVGIARKYADNKNFINKLDTINRDVIDQGLENYKGPRTIEAPDGKTYKIETSGKTGSGKTSWRSQADANKYTQWRKETIPMITDKDLISKGNAKMKALNAKGLEGHHIVPLHVSRELMESMSPKQWIARKAADAKKGIFHGHDPRNIVGAKHSTRKPHKESDLWHRTGTPDSPGYHALEKQVDWVKEGLTPFRDKMVQQVKPGRQARYRKGLGKIKKTNPTQWSDFRARNIKRDVELFGQAEWKVGDAKVTWYPNKNNPLKGRGQIDILEQAGKTNPKGVKALIKDFNDSLKDFPSGVQVELNPKWKDAKRRSIYENYIFKNHPNIKRNADPTLGWVYTAP